MIERARRRFAAAAAESVMVGLLARGSVLLRSPGQAASIDPAGQAADLAVVRHVFIGSRLFGPAWRLLAEAARGYGDSAAVRGVERWRARVGELPVWQRARAVGIALVAAVLTDAVVSMADRRPASEYRWVMWGVLLAAGVLISACAVGIEAAWPASLVAGRRR